MLSYNGTINLDDNTDINVTQSDEHKQDGKTLLTSSAVSSEASAGDRPINMSGNVRIFSNGLGITARGNINIKEADDDQSATQVQVETTRATGIYVNGGTFKVERRAQISVKSTVSADYAWGLPPEGIGTSPNIYNGVYVENGSIDASKGTLNVTHTGVATAENANATTSFPTAVQTKSYAVYVTGEVGGDTDVKIGSGTINAAQAGGVYVENGAVSLGASSKNVTINTGGWKDAQDQIDSTQGTYASAVYANGGTVTMNGTIYINSAAIGIVATAADTGTGTGAVTIERGTTTITAYRSTGVYIRGGSLTNNGTLNVTSTITNSTGGTANTAAEAYKWAGADIEGDTENENIYNGVFVNGGSLESTGTLKVTFTGVQNESKYDIDTLLATYGITLPTIGGDGIGSTTQRFWENDNSAWNNFYNAYRAFNTPSFQEVQQAVSYAVRVEAGESANTNVTINSGNITNSVGGGVLVNGGTVHLGTSANNLEIHAEGNETIDKRYIYTFTRETGTGGFGSGHWRDPYYEYTIQVRSAMYFAEIDNPAQNWAYRENQTGGDAVRVEGGTLTIKGGTYTSAQGNGIVAVGGTTTIKGGTFNGSDNYQVADNNGLVVPAGPAASYAFKVYGGEITVSAGTFGDPDSTSGASGGFVMGTSAEAPGTAFINGGTFAVSNVNTGGQAGFGVYRYANVTFGREGTTGDIQVAGLAAGLVLERTQGDSGTTVTINRGTFSSTRTESGSSDGVWYGNGTSKLNITGGTFTGAARSGLYFEVNQWNDVENKGNAFITGGTFIGNSSSQGRYWINGAIGAPSSGIDEGVGRDIQIQDFIDCSSGKYIDYYSNANGTTPDSSVALSSYIGMDRGNQKINQTTCRYNKVIIR